MNNKERLKKVLEKWIYEKMYVCIEDELMDDLVNKITNKQFDIPVVGVSLPTNEEINIELKNQDKRWNLNENINEKQAFNLGFRTCYRWFKNKII